MCLLRSVSKRIWRQFALLVLINAFVGGMVGLERTVVPLIGSEEFGIASTTLVVSFIISFGVMKACPISSPVSLRMLGPQARAGPWLALRLAGSVHDHLGSSWSWIIAANALLGINQGLRLVNDSDHEG